MKRRVLISGPEGEEFFLECENSLETVPFTPLEERLQAEDPALLEGVAKIKAGMEDRDFQRYINSLLSVKKHGDTVFLITRGEMNKTILEFKFLKLIAESFGLSKVRVFSQRY